LPAERTARCGVDVVERAREGDDADLHAARLVLDRTVKSSITGLDSSVSAIFADLGEPARR
jgi:hypothetical protein